MKAKQEKLPSSWALVRLGDFVESEKGKKPKHESKTPSERFCIPYVDIEAFEDGRTKSWTDGDGCKFCDERDFLMVWDGSRSGLVGRGVSGAVGSTLVRLRFPGLNNNYAFYFLESKYHELNTRARGSGTPHVNPDILWNYLLPIPPIEEQRRIVLKLDELFSELDNGVDSLSETSVRLQILRRSLLAAAFRGFKKTAPLKEVSEAIGGQAFKSDSFAESGRYQVIRIGNVRRGNIRLAESPIYMDSLDIKGARRALLIPGDVLITLTGTRKKRDYGFTAIVKSQNLLLNQRVASLRFIPEVYLPEFFLYYSWTETFKDAFFENETGNVGQGNVGMGAIKETHVPLADIQTQREVVRVLEAKLSLVDEVAKTIEEHLRAAKVLRHSILQRAFSGQLVTQNAADETASQFLERIRAEVVTDRPPHNKNKKEAA